MLIKLLTPLAMVLYFCTQPKLQFRVLKALYYALFVRAEKEPAPIAAENKPYKLRKSDFLSPEEAKAFAEHLSPKKLRKSKREEILHRLVSRDAATRDAASMDLDALDKASAPTQTPDNDMNPVPQLERAKRPPQGWSNELGMAEISLDEPEPYFVPASFGREST